MPDVLTMGEVRIRTFGGRVSNVDACDVPIGGAVDIKNLRTNVPGQMSVRGGIQTISATNSTTATTASVKSMYSMQSPLGDIVVYQGTDGQVRILKGVT